MTEKLFGYAGKQLRVSLTDGEVKEESLDPTSMRKYLGGSGYAAKVLYDELEAGVDPLSEDNKIIFATSPLTTRQVPGGGSLEVCYKSPLTGTWGESRVGDEFGFNLKKAGYDFLIVEGKAKEPSYLVINNGNVEIKTAENLKGKSSSEKSNIIADQYSDDFVTMAIGQAGENLVRYASIMVNFSAVGRGGAGAVLGSKNLMAITAYGDKDIEVADKDKFREAFKIAHNHIKEHPDTKEFGEHGTTGDIPGCDEVGDFPTKNWQSNSWGKGEEIYDYYYENNLIGNESCYKGCPVACKRNVKVDDGEYKTPEHQGAEYETVAAFTAFVLNENVDAAVNCSYLCDEYGLDTISTGAAIAFAMECYENGILDKKDVDGLELDWGNHKVMPELVKKIANREGIGDLLAEGVKAAADKLGDKAKEYAVQVKGLEGPAHDPRSGKALAVSYGTGNRGSCHIHPVEAMGYDAGKMDFEMSDFGLPDPENVGRWDEKGKGTVVKLLQDGGTLPDIMGTCKFMFYVGSGLKDFADMLAGLTGWDVDGWELLKVGERSINLQRLFNLREGFSREDDMIHPRMGMTPEFGNYGQEEDCSVKDFSSMLDEFYKERGWDLETGKPTAEKLTELGLEDYIG